MSWIGRKKRMATVSVGRTPIGVSLRGFKLAPSKRKQAPPRNGGIRKVTFGLKGGTLQLKAVNIPEASSHEVRWAERKIDRSPLDNEWTKTSFSDKRKFPLITDLKPGTFYVFQVRALIGEEFTDWSDSVTQMYK